MNGGCIRELHGHVFTYGAGLECKLYVQISLLNLELLSRYLKHPIHVTKIVFGAQIHVIGHRSANWRCAVACRGSS
jgi:hypothetical protein